MDLQHDGYHFISMRPAVYKKRLTRLVRLLKEVDARTPFQAMAFRGMSGALLVQPLAMRLDKNLIMVRKPNDDSHTMYGSASGMRDAEKYIIVDDFQTYGGTARAIVAAVKNFAPQAECLGIFEVNRFFNRNADDAHAIEEKFLNYELTKIKGE